MNINEKLQAVKNAKDAIKEALAEKNINMDGKTFNQYADIIKGINPGPIESFSGTKEYKNFVEAEELKYMNVRGALLWQNIRRRNLLVSNGDSEEPGYWDPNAIDMNQPTKAGYTLIAACLGNGYWGRVGYAGLTTTKEWCQPEDGANAFLLGACYHSGYEITKFMTSEGHPTYSEESIWGLRDKDSLKDHIYIPNCAELAQVCNLARDHTPTRDSLGIVNGYTYNKNLGKLFDLQQVDFYYMYWSASQYPYEPQNTDAGMVRFANGQVSYNSKSEYRFRSFALLHFGA